MSTVPTNSFTVHAGFLVLTVSWISQSVPSQGTLDVKQCTVFMPVIESQG